MENIWNFKFQEYRELSEYPSLENMSEYIPQLDSAQGLYRTYVASGLSPVEAVQKVLNKTTEIYERQHINN